MSRWCGLGGIPQWTRPRVRNLYALGDELVAARAMSDDDYCPECGCPENEHDKDGCHALDLPELGLTLDCKCTRHQHAERQNP
ncbi:hypothetical protein MSIM_07110 [Mycobacterium simiae]|nr:hypothetical protein MSIM_07110 [Mycobacterium simiae]